MENCSLKCQNILLALRNIGNVLWKSPKKFKYFSSLHRALFLIRNTKRGSMLDNARLFFNSHGVWQGVNAWPVTLQAAQA